MHTDSPDLNVEIRQAILDNPHVKPGRLHFVTSGDCVTLTGTVDSFFAKQMTQEALRRVPGLNHIHNQLEVSW